MSNKVKDLQEKVYLAMLKYTSYTINILIIGAIVGAFYWFGLILLESIKL